MIIIIITICQNMFYYADSKKPVDKCFINNNNNIYII